MNDISIILLASSLSLIVIIAALLIAALAYKKRAKLLSAFKKPFKNPFKKPSTPSNMITDPYTDPENIPIFLYRGSDGYEFYEQNFVLKASDLRSDPKQTLEKPDEEFNIPLILTSLLSSFYSNSSCTSRNHNLKHLGDMIINCAIYPGISDKGEQHLKEQHPDKIRLSITNHSSIRNRNDIMIHYGKNMEKNIYIDDIACPIQQLESQYVSTFIQDQDMKKEFKSLPIQMKGLLLGILKASDFLVWTINKLRNDICYKNSPPILYRVLIKHFKRNKLWNYTNDTKDEYNDCRADWEALLNKYFPDHPMLQCYNDTLKKPDISNISDATKKMIATVTTKNNISTIGDYIEKFTVASRDYKQSERNEDQYCYLNQTQDQIDNRKTYIEELLSAINNFYATGTTDLNKSDNILSIFTKGQGYKEFSDYIESVESAIIPNEGELTKWYFGNKDDHESLKNNHFFLNNLYSDQNSIDYLRCNIYNHLDKSNENQKLFIHYLLTNNPQKNIYFIEKIYKTPSTLTNNIPKIFDFLLSKIKPAIDILQSISIFHENTLSSGTMFNEVEKIKHLSQLVLGDKTSKSNLSVQQKLDLLQGLLMDFILSLDMSQILTEYKQSVNDDELFTSLLSLLEKYLRIKIIIPIKDITNPEEYNKRAEAILKHALIAISGTMMSTIVTSMHYQDPSSQVAQACYNSSLSSLSNEETLPCNIYTKPLKKSPALTGIIPLFNNHGVLTNTSQDNNNKVKTAMNSGKLYYTTSDDNNISKYEWITQIITNFSGKEIKDVTETDAKDIAKKITESLLDNSDTSIKTTLKTLLNIKKQLGNKESFDLDNIDLDLADQYSSINAITKLKSLKHNNTLTDLISSKNPLNLFQKEQSSISPKNCAEFFSKDGILIFKTLHDFAEMYDHIENGYTRELKNKDKANNEREEELLTSMYIISFISFVAIINHSIYSNNKTNNLQEHHEILSKIPETMIVNFLKFYKDDALMQDQFTSLFPNGIDDINEILGKREVINSPETSFQCNQSYKTKDFANLIIKDHPVQPNYMQNINVDYPAFPMFPFNQVTKDREYIDPYPDPTDEANKIPIKFTAISFPDGTQAPEI